MSCLLCVVSIWVVLFAGAVFRRRRLRCVVSSSVCPCRPSGCSENWMVSDLRVKWKVRNEIRKHNPNRNCLSFCFATQLCFSVSVANIGFWRLWARSRSFQWKMVWCLFACLLRLSTSEACACASIEKITINQKGLPGPKIYTNQQSEVWMIERRLTFVIWWLYSQKQFYDCQLNLEFTIEINFNFLFWYLII